MGDTTRLIFDPEVSESFRVDQKKRTISGLAVPWGKVARSGFSRWRFRKGSLRWADARRVKLNLGHDPDKAVGFGTRVQNATAGLDTTFKIGEFTEGDDALVKARSGVFDGLSIEVMFEDDDGWETDDDGVRNVFSARLVGVALTAVPSFDDARVTGVAASRNKQGDKRMSDNNTELTEEVQAQLAAFEKKLNEYEPQPFDGEAFNKAMSAFATQLAEAHQELTEEVGESLAASVTAGLKTVIEEMGDGGPAEVNAARYSINREDPIYHFDGSRGDSLVRDAYYAKTGKDEDAIERLRQFRQQQIELEKVVTDWISYEAARQLQFTPVTTTSAADVIPPGYRPDLFVPELAQGRPLYNLLSRGSISNATPFVVPTFGSATGMTGDHTEGSPPTEGTLTVGSETVSPVAVSGKLPLTREIVDSSNPAIDAIALAAMRESYSQQTEVKVYAALNGAATGSQFIQPFAATDPATKAGGVYDTRRLLARYPFIRFASPTGGAINQKVTEDFATAADTTGQPLLPSIGAQNRAGIGNAVQQGWFVDGLPFVPAWAIGDALSDDVLLLLNRMDAWAWESSILSFRFEEKSGPELIELALFGYFATHVLRAAGIFAIRNSAV